MQSIKGIDRYRLASLLLFTLLGALMIAAWMITGQREWFEAPMLIFGATGLMLLFGFF